MVNKYQTFSQTASKMLLDRHQVERFFEGIGYPVKREGNKLRAQCPKCLFSDLCINFYGDKHLIHYHCYNKEKCPTNTEETYYKNFLTLVKLIFDGDMRTAVCTISKFLKVRPNSLFDGSAIKHQSPTPIAPGKPKVVSEPKAQPTPTPASKPHDMAAERGVLAGIWQYGRDGLLSIQDIVTEDSFSDPANKVLFSVLCQALKNSSSVDWETMLSTAHEMGVELFDNRVELDMFRAITNTPINTENVRVLASKLADPWEEYASVSSVAEQQFDDEKPPF